MADVRTPELVINKLTKQQYENIQNPSDTEIYLVPEDEEHKPICYPTTASDVNPTSMVVKSSVSDNGKILTENGFVYNTSGNPTISDTKVICDLVSGIILTHITGLTGNTPYYIRSYGINAGGTTYGDVLTVTTEGSPIPSEYQLVEYLENQNECYINLNYTAILGFTVKSKVMHTSYTNFNTYIGSYSTSQGNLHNIIRMRNISGYGLNPCIGTSNNYIYGGLAPLNTEYEFEASNYSNYIWVRLNNTLLPNNTQVVSGTYSNLPLYVFNLNYQGSIVHGHAFKGRMYYMKIFTTDVMNPDIELYPVYRITDNKPGMYDIVNNVFYTNQGAGEFIVGPDKEWGE